MMLQSIRVVVFVCVLGLLGGAEQAVCQPVAPSAAAAAVRFDPDEDFGKRLRLLSDLAPDPCGPPFPITAHLESEDHESRLFDDASELVAANLNQQAGSVPDAPGARARRVLEGLRSRSATVNANWPEENRLQYRILELGPLLLVQISVRTYASFRAFALTDSSGSQRRWQEVGSDGKTELQRYSRLSLELYPLYSGSAGRVRFLGQFLISGCAGSYGVEYDAWEWSSRESSSLDQIISQSGVLGLDGRVPGFEWIGKLKTEGPRITLPYCWFSAIDSWDNPSLCAVDTYDLSGPQVRFQSRQVNRPDLLPIAKAVEYAQRHDYLAVRAYCDSDAVAQRLLREIPPVLFGDGELKIRRLGKHRERVDLGDDEPAYRFDVTERGGEWVVTGFAAP